jgi:hypothetical protein
MGLREELREALDQDGFPRRSLLIDTMERLEGPRIPRLRFGPALAALIAVALVVTLVAVRLNISPSPATGPTLPTTNVVTNLGEAHFVSAQVGWVHMNGKNDVVARTADGGRTWHHALSIRHGFPLTLQALDASVAVLMGYDVHDDGLVWKTDDGGAHWTKHVISSPQPGSVIGSSGYFHDSRIGWFFFAISNCGALMGCAGQSVLRQLVYQTADGGATWAQVGTNPVRWRDLALHFISPTAGIAVGGDTVATTHDGGRSWNSTQPVPTPDCVGCGPLIVMNATMLDEMNAVLDVRVYYLSASRLSVRLAYVTTDGGTNWREEPKLLQGVTGVVIFNNFSVFTDVTAQAVGAPSGWSVDSAQFVGKDGWVIITALSREVPRETAPAEYRFEMRATTDGGRTWHLVRLPKV